MRWLLVRRCLVMLALVLGLSGAFVPVPLEDVAPARPGWVSQPATAPILQNPNFECSAGFDAQEGLSGAAPRGWTAILLEGQPDINSTRLAFTGVCGEDGFIERIEGLDSLVYVSQDIETPPEPGKPFDAAGYQQFETVAGQAYSLSGWMVSLCGGSFAAPNDCPADYYMTKLLGIDPAGGVDPLADRVIWVEDRRNFTESRWVNQRLAATADDAAMTVLVRVSSPFRWHGNHAFADAISIVRAPTAHFVDLPTTITNTQTVLGWAGDLGPDIPAIPAGTHQLVFDIQYRDGVSGAWADWLTDQPAGGALFTAALCSGERTYDFRMRARAEQPEGAAGGMAQPSLPRRVERSRSSDLCADRSVCSQGILAAHLGLAPVTRGSAAVMGSPGLDVGAVGIGCLWSRPSGIGSQYPACDCAIPCLGRT